MRGVKAPHSRIREGRRHGEGLEGMRGLLLVRGLEGRLEGHRRYLSHLL